MLFRYANQANIVLEPVYNIDVAWPDDARAVRAHDLGDALNAKLFLYYAAYQPDRAVYRYDRGDETLTHLGSVAELAAKTRRQN